jgi:hypothetical protein
MNDRLIHFCQTGKLSQLKRAIGCHQYMSNPDTLYQMFYEACMSNQIVCAKWLWHQYQHNIIKSEFYPYIAFHIYMAENYDVYEWLNNKCNAPVYGTIAL